MQDTPPASLNWDDLRIFLAAARAQTLAAAARRLGIDASTVGRRLARLSALLDAALFEQGPAGQTLTEPGRRLLAYAESAEQAATGALSDLTGTQGQLAGTVRVSLPEGLATHIIAPAIAGFQQANPDIRVELIVTNGFLNPSKRETDLAIMLARPARGPLLTRRLTDYRLRLYIARERAARHGLPPSRAALGEHPLIGYAPDFIYADELRYMGEIAPGLEAGIVSSSINVQHRLVSAGAGIGVLPCFIGDADNSLQPLFGDDIMIQRIFWLVVHRDIRPLARVAAFIAWLDQLLTEKRTLIRGAEAG